MKYLLCILLSASALLGPAISQPVDSFDVLVARAGTPPQTPAKKPVIPNDGHVSPPDAPSKDGKKASIDIDKYISEWMGDKTNKDKLANSASTTNGGWECWAQFELEYYIKKEMQIPTTTKVREVRVYADKNLAADFAFDPITTSNKKGIILELKCENQNMQGMKAKVEADIEKLKKPLDAKYKDYDRVAYAMAYTPKAQKEMEELHMTSIGSGVKLLGDQEGKTLKVYRNDD